MSKTFVALGGAVIAAVVGALVLAGFHRAGVDLENVFGGPAAVTDPSTDPPGAPTPYRGGWGPSRPTFTMRSPSPTPAFNSIVDNPTHGNELNFVQCKLETAANSAYADDVIVRGPAVVDVYAWIENASTRSPRSDITGATLDVALAHEPVIDPGIGVVLRGDGVETVWDGCRLFSDQALRVQYLPESAELHTLRDGEPVTIPLADDVIIGNGRLPDAGRGEGVVPASTQPYGFVLLQVLVSPVGAA